jgi:hypothetical protein
MAKIHYFINYKFDNKYQKVDSNNFMIGGYNFYNNPKWPPYIDSKVIIKKNNKIYFGKVIANIENKTESIIKLENTNYRELSLANEALYNYGVGYMKFYKTNEWKYVTDQKPKIDINGVTEEFNDFKKKLKNKDIKDDIDLTKIIPDSQKKYISNLYKPLLTSRKDNLFADKRFEIVISNEKYPFQSLDSQLVDELQKSLKSFKEIKEDDYIRVINKSIAVDNLITNAQDEINEGTKIIDIIDNNLKSVKVGEQTINLFSDLIMKIDSGYIYITRKGIDLKSKVTRNLIPDLKYYTWQYNKPISYDTLKYVIFQNDFQKDIVENLKQKQEAERILSLEYIIALQPKSKFQYWCLKRLLMIWYGDPEIEPIIKKIKILINHFRADPYQEYNKVNGVLPMITIHLDYGINNARKIISKLVYYFSLYLDDDSYKRYQDIYWNNSHPTYFVKKNNLIYFSNGSIDLKLYIEESLDCKNKKPVNDIFDKDYKELLESGRVLSN